MEHSAFGENTNNTILNQIQEGMSVCDNDGNRMGSVRQVFLGAVSDQINDRGGGPATASAPDLRDESLVDNLAEVFAADDPLPETVRGRLLRHGFVRIDTAGLFAADRFALPEQIASVSDDCVQLRVTKDELIKY